MCPGYFRVYLGGGAINTPLRLIRRSRWGSGSVLLSRKYGFTAAGRRHLRRWRRPSGKWLCDRCRWLNPNGRRRGRSRISGWHSGGGGGCGGSTRRRPSGQSRYCACRGHSRGPSFWLGLVCLEFFLVWRRFRVGVYQCRRRPQLIPEIDNCTQRKGAEERHGDIEGQFRIGLAEFCFEYVFRRCPLS